MDVFCPGGTVSILSRPKNPNRTPLSQRGSLRSPRTTQSKEEISVPTGFTNPPPPQPSWGPPQLSLAQTILPQTRLCRAPHPPPVRPLEGQPHNMLSRQQLTILTKQPSDEPSPLSLQHALLLLLPQKPHMPSSPSLMPPSPHQASSSTNHNEQRSAPAIQWSS